MAHPGFTETNGKVPTTKGNLILVHVPPLSMSCKNVHLTLFLLRHISARVTPQNNFFVHQDLEFMSFSYKMSSFPLTSLSSVKSKEALLASSLGHRQTMCSLEVPLFLSVANINPG